MLLPIQFIYPRSRDDSRSWFTKTYNRDAAAHGIDVTFAHDNHFLLASAFTLRGLHFQTPLRGQDKLVRCIRGRTFDVAVDARNGSPTYGQRVGAELRAENGGPLFIPLASHVISNTRARLRDRVQVLGHIRSAREWRDHVGQRRDRLAATQRHQVRTLL